ncbi:unnamed protein product [Caenorhabditis sp. 36 PRJEB53466]|nr:unnamed protein product [Caenorhabditis sp. 36 PRJEB53466]
MPPPPQPRRSKSHAKGGKLEKDKEKSDEKKRVARSKFACPGANAPAPTGRTPTKPKGQQEVVKSVQMAVANPVKLKKESKEARASKAAAPSAAPSVPSSQPISPTAAANRSREPERKSKKPSTKSDEKVSDPKEKEKDEGKGANTRKTRTTESKLSSQEKSLEQMSYDSKDETEQLRMKFNKNLAQKFFKQMMESTKARKRRDDAKLETMPESSQINASMRALKKKKKKKDGASKMVMLSGPENLFKANGEPVWVVAERAPGEGEKDEDGVVVANPELVHALAEDDLVIEEKDWIETSDAYMSNRMKKGRSIPKSYRFNPYATFKSLEKTNAYTTPETVAYFTIRNLVELSEEALKRFTRRQTEIDEEPRSRPERRLVAKMEKKPSTMTAEAPAPKRLGKIKFDFAATIQMNYDRKNPLLSIQRLRRQIHGFVLEKTQEVSS